VDTGALAAGGVHASSVHGELGTWRHLAFVFEKVNVKGHGTLFDEIDILSVDDALPAFHDRNARQVVLRSSQLPEGVTLSEEVLRIAAGTPAFDCRVAYADIAVPAPRELAPLLAGGPGIYPEVQVTQGQRGADTAPYAVDSLTLPVDNPWGSRTRFGGFDFFADGKRAACSTWNGDVWIAEGIDTLAELRWRRFASGMFQPLGLRIVDEVIYVQGRDQMTRLHDRNGDGEADFYECFNNQVQITDGFHEFSFDLQTDAAGNFYFSKGMPVLAGGRGFAPWTPHTGAVLKVSPDGKTLERVAWGLRAPGGIGIGPNGEISTGENEGSWVPRCKITWSKPGSFHGVVPSEWDGRNFVRTLPDAPTEYEKPLCWLPYHVDNSSGSQIWSPEGELLHLSYGKASIFRVLREEVDGQVQGGVTRLPIDLAVAPMRARFHANGDLYVIGFRGWQTSGADGFQRIRRIGAEAPSPVSLEAHENGLVIGFSGPLAESATDPLRYTVSKWKYIWGPQYGSGRFSIDNPDREAEARALQEPSKGAHNKIDRVRVRAVARLSDERVFLYIPGMTTAMQMEIRIDLESARTSIYNTVHQLRPAFEDHGLDLAKLPELTRVVSGEPGLVMRLAFRSTDDVTRVDRLALNVAAGDSITPFFRPRDFEATFEGDLVVPARDDLAFRLLGSGYASLSLGGEPVAEGPLPLSVEPRAMNAGPHSLFASFRGDKKGVGRLQFQWSGRDFVWEPVPPSAFRYQPDRALAQKDLIREGRAIFAAARCIRCHATGDTRMPELAERDADFANLGGRIDSQWLLAWLRSPQGHCPPVAVQEAGDVVSWFQRSAEQIEMQAVEPEAVDSSLLAPWLEEIRGKYTPAGLRQYLADPSAHHPDTLFPKFQLTAGQIETLAATDRPLPEQEFTGDAARGKQVVEARCLMCHGDAKPAASPLATVWKRDWSSLAAHDPPLGLDVGQVEALSAFQRADSDTGLQSLKHFTPREYAARSIERLRCGHCHQGELPDISGAGAKLQGPWLADLLRGRHPPTRPWLSSQMPAFPSRAEALARALCDRDGVPYESANSAVAESAIGKELAGLQGYACNACHAVGDRPALQAFEGKGPNLSLAKGRLREAYFLRWMHHPQRIQPGTIMPRYALDKSRAAKTDVLDGDAEAQFRAIWAWLQGL
jgi:mono/diheme cytochrome c family protein